MPVSSVRATNPDSEQSYLNDQNRIFLPVIFTLLEIGPSKIYCMGDSLTETGVYEAELSSLLGPDWSTINLGRSGDKTSDMVTRFQAEVIDSGDAAYVIIWGGVVDLFYDTAEDTESNLQAMYTMAHNAGIKVVAVNIIPLNDISADNKKKLLEINSWIKITATNVDFVADVYTNIEDPNNPGNILPAYDAGDHVHLSDAGYTMVAQTIYGEVEWTHTFH
jgi:lysophospholipase L1-like esterase